MKNTLFFVFLLLVLPSICLAAENGSITFCENFDDQWNPIKPGTEFQGITISWIATAEKQYGIPEITLTVYKHDGKKETLINRKNIEVNPEWDTTGIRFMTFPSEGEYTITLTTPKGEILNKGRIVLLDGKSSGTPPKEETLGARLEALFKKYSPK